MLAHSGSVRGLTLIEILIAMVLLLIIAVATVGMITYSGQAGAANAQHSRAIDLAEELMEQIIAAPFDEVTYGGQLPVSSALLASGELPADNSPQAFTGLGELGSTPQWAIDIADDAGGIYRIVTITVSWTDPIRLIPRTKVLRAYRYDDEIVAYPYRQEGAGT